MIYSDWTEFLEVLDTTLRKQAQQLGRNQDYINLREELAIERFLARIDPEIAIVKGGTAAMLTIPNAPHTKDVDLVIPDAVVQSLRLDKLSSRDRANALADFLQEHVRKSTPGDFFRFKFEEAFAIEDLKPGHACARINISVMVGTSEMHFMQVDIALQEGELPSQLVQGRDMLGFAGVTNPHVRTVTPEYLVADKVTLYLEEHGVPDANRVKDIVHAALVIEGCSLDTTRLTELLADRAVHREVVGKLKKGIPDPPTHWNDPFEELMEQAQSTMTMQQAIKKIRKAIDEVSAKAVVIAEKGIRDTNT
jgi:hypothetical protein